MTFVVKNIGLSVRIKSKLMAGLPGLTVVNCRFQGPSSRKYGYLPRFPRIQLLHELLWQLVYGQFAQEASDVTGVDESKVGAGQKSPLDYDRQVTRNLDDDHEWLKHLKPMPKLYDEARQPLHGWFRMADVLLVMPLEIFCRIVDITEEVRTE